jgi:hypothetical protein
VIYKALPPVGSLILPKLDLLLDGNSSSRFGASVRRVWIHRWGGGTFPGVERWFENPTSDASSHIVYAGEIGPYAGQAAQMVRYGRKAWTEAFYNRTGVSIESADAIWLGHDPYGFARLARQTAFLLHHFDLPPTWVHGSGITFGKGFSRHADGGQLAGGHTACPTTDMYLWNQFIIRVQAEHRYGHFRPKWGVT